MRATEVPPTKFSAQLVSLDREQIALHELARDTNSLPTCTPPKIPAATYPPGQPYGVPFLAAITNGQVLAGYDEWTANHIKYTVGGKTYTNYPWQSKFYDISGWVTGLIQLPSLNAVIPPQDIVFCQAGPTCLNADWPAGQCIHFITYPPWMKGQTTPGPPLSNVHAEGVDCYNTFGCLPYIPSLTPSGNSSLTVTGVEPDGALDLQVKTAATTSIDSIPSSGTQLVCTDAAASITLSTVNPSSLPPSAPIQPKPPNPDDRQLQTAPLPLTGPLALASSTVASNSFSVPAFPYTSPTCSGLGIVLNVYAGGWGPKLGALANYLPPDTNPIVAPSGWAQFSATTSVVTLGFPVGPPPGFNF